MKKLALLGLAGLALAAPAVAAAPAPIYTQSARLALAQHSCPEDAFKFIPAINSGGDPTSPGGGFSINPDNRVRCVPMDGGRVTIAKRRGGIG